MVLMMVEGRVGGRSRKDKEGARQEEEEEEEERKWCRRYHPHP